MRASAPIPRIDRPTHRFGRPPLPPSRPPVAARRMSVKGRSCPAGPCAALSRRGGPVIARPVSGAAADGLVVIERLCGHRVARRRPVLPEVNARHRLKRHGWSSAVWPKLWVVRRLQPPQPNHRIHFGQKLLAPWCLLHCMAKTGNGGLFAHRRGSLSVDAFSLPDHVESGRFFRRSSIIETDQCSDLAAFVLAVWAIFDRANMSAEIALCEPAA